MACHGSNPKPIWRDYRAWAGVYGSFADTLFDGTEEATSYKNFYQSINKNKKDLFEWPKPYQDPLQGTNFSLPPYFYNLDPKKNGNATSDDFGMEGFDPNSRLGHVLNILNAKRLASAIDPSLRQRYSTLLFHTVNGCTLHLSSDELGNLYKIINGTGLSIVYSGDTYTRNEPGDFYFLSKNPKPPFFANRNISNDAFYIMTSLFQISPEEADLNFALSRFPPTTKGLYYGDGFLSPMDALAVELVPGFPQYARFLIHRHMGSIEATTSGNDPNYFNSVAFPEIDIEELCRLAEKDIKQTLLH